MKPLKILVLSHSSELGGAERSMIDVFDNWDKKGVIEPHFIIRKPLKNMVPELKKRKWRYYPLYYTNWSQRTPSKRPADIYRNALYNTEALFAIEKLIQKINPDVVMTNTIVAPWAALAAHFQRKPHIWFVREYGDIDHQHIFELGRQKMLEDIDTLSDLVVANSKTLEKHVNDYIDKNKTTVIYTPFDLDVLERKSQQPVKNPFKSKDSLKLVITGKIAPSKGQSEAAEAVGQLIKRGYDAELCVIGLPVEPHDADSLKAVIKKYDIADKVHLVGQQSNPLAILTLADIGIMASRQEAFGRVTFEYMATNRPVVGANSGATPEMIEHGKNGYLYKQGNAASLVEQLLHYAKDRSLIEKHGDAGKQKAIQMMKGEYNGTALFKKVQAVVDNKDRKTHPLNFSHRWLEYPLIARDYIKDVNAESVKKLFILRLRQKAKSIVLRVSSLFDRQKN